MGCEGHSHHASRKDSCHHESTACPGCFLGRSMVNLDGCPGPNTVAPCCALLSAPAAAAAAVHHRMLLTANRTV